MMQNVWLHSVIFKLGSFQNLILETLECLFNCTDAVCSLNGHLCCKMEELPPKNGVLAYLKGPSSRLIQMENCGFNQNMATSALYCFDRDMLHNFMRNLSDVFEKTGGRGKLNCTFDVVVY